MKTVKEISIKIIYITFFIVLFSCKKENENKKEMNKAPVFKITSTDTISYGYNNRLYDIKQTKNNDFRILLNISENNTSLKSKNKFITISRKGKIKKEQDISFKHQLTDYIEFNNGFYSVNTLRVTMGKNFTHDFLSKYDKNWNLLWQKELSTHKYPSGKSFIRLLNKGRLMLITDTYNKNKFGFSIQEYDEQGNIKFSSFFKNHSNPSSVTKTLDNNLLISTFKNKTDSLVILKKEISNKTIWKQTIDENINPKQVLQTKDSSFIIYGTKYKTNSTKHLLVLKVNKKGELIWTKTINKNYNEDAGNIIEYGDNFVFSSAVTPSKDRGSYSYIFELDNNGKILSDKKFIYVVGYLGISSVPYLINDNGKLTMITQKWIGKFGDPFHDIILINTIEKQ